MHRDAKRNPLLLSRYRFTRQNVESEKRATYRGRDRPTRRGRPGWEACPAESEGSIEGFRIWLKSTQNKGQTLYHLPAVTFAVYEPLYMPMASGNPTAVNTLRGAASSREEWSRMNMLGCAARGCGTSPRDVDGCRVSRVTAPT